MASTGAIRAAQAYVELFIENSKLMAGLKLAEQELHNFGSRVQSLGQKMAGFGAMMGVPIAAAVRNYMDFDDTMKAVQGVTGATGADFDKLTEKAKYLGRTTSFTAKDVADAMLELGRAGFKTDQIDAGIASVMNLSRATQTDIPRATEIAANALSGFGLEAGQMGRVADVLAATANNSAQTVDDIGEALNYVAPIANEAGMSIEDVCKVLGTLANFGIKGSMAGTSVKNILTRMADPQVQALYKSLGVSVTDAAGNLRNMSDVLREVGQATESLPNAERLATFQALFDMRALPAGAKLTGEAFENMINAIDNASGEAARVAEVMDSSIGGAFRSMMSAVEGVGHAIGAALNDSLSNRFHGLADALNLITEMINQNKQLVVSFTMVVGGVIATGMSLIALGGASKLAAGAIGLIRVALLTVAQIALSPFKLIASAIGFILSPAGAAVAAIGAIGFAAYQIYQYRDAIPSLFREGIGVAKSASTAISTALTSAFDGVKDAAGAAFGAISSVVGPLAAAYKAFGAGVLGVFGAIGTALATAFKFVVNIFTKIAYWATMPIRLFIYSITGIVGMLKTIIYGIGVAFVTMGKIIYEIGGACLKPFAAAFMAVFRVVASIVSTIAKVIFVPIIQAVSYVASKLAAGFAMAFSLIMQVIGGAVRLIALFFEGLVGIILMPFKWAAGKIMDLLSPVIGWIKTAFGTIVQVVASVVSSIVEWFKFAFALVYNITASVFSGIASAVGAVAGVIASAFSSVVSFLGGLWNAVAGFFGGIGNFFAGFSEAVSSVLGESFSFLGELVQWLKGRFSSLVGFCSGAFSAIAEALASGNITAAAKMVWASLKMLWQAGCYALLTYWYTLCYDLQKIWTEVVYFLASVFVKGFYNVQIWWSKFVNGIANLWMWVCNFVAGIWDNTLKAVEKAIAKAYAFATGATDAETQKILAEIDAKYQEKADKREQEQQAKFNQRNQEAEQNQLNLENDKNGILDILAGDENNKLQNIQNEFDRNNAENISDFENAKKEYNEAMANAKNPPKPEEDDDKLPDDKKEGKLSEKTKKLLDGLKVGGVDVGSLVTGDIAQNGFEQMGLGEDLNDAMDGYPSQMEQTADSGSEPSKRGSFKASELEGGDSLSWMKRNQEDQIQLIRDIKELMAENGDYL